MPIILDQIGKNTGQKAYLPKFFDNELTGTGKTQGLINQSRNPDMILPTVDEFNPQAFPDHKRTYSNGTVDFFEIPMAVLTRNTVRAMDVVKKPDLSVMAPFASVNGKNTVFLSMQPYGLFMEKESDNTGYTKKTVTVGYDIMVWVENDSAKDVMELGHVTDGLSDFDARRILSIISRPGNQNTENIVCHIYSTNPRKSLETLETEAASYNHSVTFVPDAVKNFIDGYGLFDGICAVAEQWDQHTDEILNILFTNMAAKLARNASTKMSCMNYIERELRRIEDFPVPLDTYGKIYQNLTSNFDPADVTNLCRQNLKLMLSNNLHNLEVNKPNLVAPPPLPAGKTPLITIPSASPQQIAAITAPESLVMIQAGAGSGKSQTILARINYLVDLGVDPNDITVLSFTNAAANHISELNSAIHSMTIAKMVTLIYEKNYPTHMLSTIETITNSLDIEYPNDKDVKEFMWKLRDTLSNKKQGAFTALNNYVEEHFGDVVTWLDKIKQTCLELEIIFCYQKIDTMVEPPEVTSKFLIIDEVQDNSVFEFVYAIKYTEKHLQSLYIVGDCSQTLYEFRSSNPKALNMLESSGVFKAYQLTVNYRSNQEILDFANVILDRIEANQYARIQLQANSLAKPTLQSFQDRVVFKYRQVATLKEFNENMDAIFAVEVKPYVDKCLAAGEKVAFMAFTRREVDHIRAILEHMYPGKSIVPLTSERSYNSTVFSSFIKKYWDQMQFAPTNNIVHIVRTQVMQHLDNLITKGSVDKARKPVGEMLNQWDNQNGSIISNWQRMYTAGRMSLRDFTEDVKRNMLEFEIRNNAIRQATLSSKNEERRNAENVAKADMLVSTIHGVKGLEFPHTVVLYRNENNMAEDKKRMYYVALTRAMQSELVLVYDTTVYPKIQSDYEEICSILAGKPIKLNPAQEEDGDYVTNAANKSMGKAKAYLKTAGLGGKTLGDLMDEEDEQDGPSRLVQVPLEQAMAEADRYEEEHAGDDE